MAQLLRGLGAIWLLRARCGRRVGAAGSLVQDDQLPAAASSRREVRLRNFAMPTTRAARAAARAAALQKLIELPADVLSLVLYQLPLAHDIAAVAPTSHAVADAAKLALKLRPFSGKLVKLAGHFRSVYSVDVAPDGRIITGSYDKTVKVWRDGVCERTIEAHTRDIEDIAALPCGTRFVSASDDGTAKLWTLDGVLERTFEINPDDDDEVHEDFTWAVAALPDGVHFVVGLSGIFVEDEEQTLGEVRLFHVDGTLVHTFKGHASSVYTLAVTPDGQHIISAAEDTLVKVWSVASKSLVSTCRGHTSRVNAVAAMPDGQRILSGGNDDTVRVWLLDGTLKNTFWHLHANHVYAVVALPDNQHALSGSQDETIHLFNVNDGAVLRIFKHHAGAAIMYPVTSLALLPDGRRFVSGSQDRTACIVEHGLAPHFAGLRVW